MAEPVRESIRRAVDETSGRAKPDETDPIGLAENGGVTFQCGTCEYFEDGVCQNPDPRLNGEKVEHEWCCNKYDRDGMRTIIK